MRIASFEKIGKDLPNSTNFFYSQSGKQQVNERIKVFRNVQHQEE